MTTRFLRLSCIAAISLTALGCSPFPRDTSDSLGEAKRFGMIVGASGDPPFVVIGPDGEVSGTDAAIVERFAKVNDFRVRWVVGGHDPLMAQLKEARLHMVIGGHAKHSPWEPQVGWSKAVPIRSEASAPLASRRFAVPPGENAWHVLLDRYLVAHESAR